MRTTSPACFVLTLALPGFLAAPQEVEVEVVDPPTGWTWRGELEDGSEQGLWRALRPGGGLAVIGHFQGGVPDGWWAFFHADGSYEPAWISGTYEAGLRVGTLARPPEGADRPPAIALEGIPPLAAPAGTQARVARWLESSGAQAQRLARELAAEALDSFPAAVDAALACDLSDPEQAARARRVHEELLAPLFGTEWAWSPGDVAGNARVLLRWRAVYELTTSHPALYLDGLRPDAEWLAAHLAGTVLPRSRAAQDAAPSRFALASPAALQARSAGKFGGRFGGRRGLRASGGSGTSEPLAAALTWLARAQEEDGRWDCENHGGDATGLDGVVTAAAALALVGDGQLLTRGQHAAAVVRAVRWVIARRDPESGALHGGGDFRVYEQALATLFLAELAAQDPQPVVGQAAVAAAEYLAALRRADGSWPAGTDRRSGDSLTTGAALLALVAAREAGRELPADFLEDTLDWFDARTAKDGLTRSESDGPLTSLGPAGATGLAFFCGVLAGRSPRSDRKAAARAAWLEGRENRPETLIDFQWSSYGAFQVGGETWKAVNTRMKKALLAAQVQPGHRDSGSWRPEDAGGRALATARGALCLEVYFRYARMLR